MSWPIVANVPGFPVMAKLEEFEQDSFVSITWSDDGEKWNEKPIRYVIERTCKRIDSPNDDEGRPNLPTCSECGEELSYTDRYCPNCGAKVVEE